jgi:hypothetical protein
MSFARSISMLALFSTLSIVFTGCMKETSTSNLDGTCKSGFVDAYNATVTATNKVADLQTSTHASGAEYSSALESAQSACKNLFTNFGDGGECEADRKGSASDLKSNCNVVDKELARLKSSRSSDSIDTEISHAEALIAAPTSENQ